MSYFSHLCCDLFIILFSADQGSWECGSFSHSVREDVLRVFCPGPSQPASGDQGVCEGAAHPVSGVVGVPAGGGAGKALQRFHLLQ